MIHAHYHLTRMTEMKRVFTAHSLASFGFALVWVFVPLFLYSSGYAPPVIFLWLAAAALVAAVCHYPALRVVAKSGPHRSMLLGIIAGVLYLGMLLSLKQYPALFIPAAALMGLHYALYWPAFHADFSRFRDRKSTGSQVGALNGIVILLTGLAPAIGGLVAQRWGTSWSYGIALILIAAAVIPLRTSMTVAEPGSGVPIRRLPWRKIAPDLFSNFCNGIESLAERALWSFLIFLTVSTYAGVGLLSSLALISAMAVSIYVGRHEQRRGVRRYIKEGTRLKSLSHIFRLMASSSLHFTGINLLTGIATQLHLTPYMTRYYEHADEEERLAYIWAMETSFQIGYAFLASFVAVLLLAGLSFKLALLIGIALAIPAAFGIRRMR